MTQKEKSILFSLMSNFIPKGYSFDDIYFFSKDEIISASVSLILEIRELKEKGYKESEIQNLIEQAFPLKEFDEEENDFLKKDAVKNLKRIFRKEEN